ncbi:Uncharacterized damage-inducible protein DinB (forms a four-helix bundle) [Chitinophaga sp. CF118]|uniref:DinB family protein n=1 Tax=Chitinophaga sp. CF118 TaxID=1884367 RepID=UPI0008EA44E1|nr:DinB family protein [Chitinophaga sp. CF118]SFD82901.1 Uncharacterized damage-inducible protein DinB (forms a four-helix bundle) [Chitinophaga sp. CF118]
MKAIHFLATLCLIFSFINLARAQESTDEIVKEWERAKAYTKEYLDVMPESGYSLKPTPEMRSFAEQMLHLADANYGLIAAGIGEKSPVGQGELEKSGDKSKENVTKTVMESYDYVINSIKKMTPAQLGEHVKLFDHFDMSKKMALAKGFEHQTHHRGQTTVYLRLAGVKPPEEKLF